MKGFTVNRQKAMSQERSGRFFTFDVRRLVRLLGVAAVMMMVGVPVGVWAADGFSDVPDSNVHHDAVNAVRDAGITEGCGGGDFCPGEFVRRDQMASFLDRTAALSGQAPVVHAATAQTAETVEGLDAVLTRLDELESANTALTQRVADLEDGAATDDLAARVDTLETTVDTLESDNDTLSTTVTELQTANDTLTTTVGDLESQVQALQDANLDSRVGEVEATLAGVSRQEVPVAPDDPENTETRDTLVFEGMNLQLLNGHEDATTATANGLGNLIVGYNDQVADEEVTAQRTGSHSVVVGDQHEWTSWGGILGGFNNTAAGPWASVTGGISNVATGAAASVAGGVRGAALGERAFIGGGDGNEASGVSAAILGGRNGFSTGQDATVVGGLGNEATGLQASVSGGTTNIASGTQASILGGDDNIASGSEASISGGADNVASSPNAAIAGGRENTAANSYASVTGGNGNIAEGVYSSVHGGQNNTASALWSTLLGGLEQSVTTDHEIYPPAP